MKKTKELRNNSGITMVSLIITIVVMLIVASTTVFVSLDRFESNNLDKMYNDIKLLADKVNNYYLKYNGLPVARKATSNEPIKYDYTTFEFTKNINDNDNYYILDLTAMEGISLNYGEGGFEAPNLSDDVYIINEKSHQIYYVRGVEVEDIIYYTIPTNESVLIDNIPPTKPEIKIVSGTATEGKYTTAVEIEIIPGKDNWSGVNETTCSIVKTIDGVEKIFSTDEINELKQNELYIIKDNGTYKITATTKDKSGNTSIAEATIVVENAENIS